MGVKSLWNLLTPVGRPVMLETVEGKTMAIDSSIWIYQFQATMRNKEGHALVNAHVVGFMRRISKLLFYGIKPVFVFDGGAPALKKSTLNERKKKKAGAAASHVKLAEKLLAAQMRREALNHAQPAKISSKSSKGKAKASQGPVVQDENTVYLEDIDNSIPRTPARKNPPTPSSNSSKAKFYDHDPYKLPEVDLEAAVSKATSSVTPDPRLATEDELRSFIEDMRPEDFDVNSPAFRELPTEVQYEIIGDLRLKSRQTSYARLQNMLKSSKTPLDFSKQQIQNLRQRNSLTQQLLTTTDSIGNAHISIPVRIASERNKEYVLMKNEGEAGGWILGIRDNSGSREKPIEIDHEQDKDNEEEGKDSDEDMEEVIVYVAFFLLIFQLLIGSSNKPAPDADLLEYQRKMAISAISQRSASKTLAPVTIRPVKRKIVSTSLFGELEEDELPMGDFGEVIEDDDLLAFAIQDSLDQAKDVNNSQMRHVRQPHPSLDTITSPAVNVNPSWNQQACGPSDARDGSPDNFFPTLTRLETALSIANAGPSRSQLPRTQSGAVSSLFGTPSLSEFTEQAFLGIRSDSTEQREGVAPSIELEDDLIIRSSSPQQTFPPAASRHSSVSNGGNKRSPMSTLVPYGVPVEDGSGSDQDMEEVPVDSMADISSASQTNVVPQQHLPVNEEPVAGPSFLPDTPSTRPEKPQIESSAEFLFAWSRTPSPLGDIHDRSSSPLPASPHVESWDAAQEMDLDAEEGEFVRFMSQVKGKQLEDVRQELDDEIKVLNEQRKAAMRDSEDITQQMISQIMIMLRLFGIPYITAPMEAEAQCAELVSLGLVDGVITDDSDVFLFGAQRVFKNMFNQSKTVECFLLSDLSRELGLDRDTLIRLAYLLGSDYVEGLPGVGPVVAMELLKEFPGKDGLHKFKDWWTKVQSGKDNDNDTNSKFKKQFKKKFKDLYLPSEWPNSAVRDAYYHPTVDSSEEPFKWGLPDLDALREFFREELGWGKAKVDELLLPIIQRMNKRNQTSALNKQGNLNDFFDVNAGSGTYAPRKHQAYASKRLQQVVKDFRDKQKTISSTPTPDSDAGSKTVSSDELSDEPLKRKRRRTTSIASSSDGKMKSNRRAVPGATARKNTRAVPRNSKKVKTKTVRVSGGEEDEEEFAPDQSVHIDVPLKVQLRPRPKPLPVPFNAGNKEGPKGIDETS